MVEPSTALTPCWEERGRVRNAAPPPGDAVAAACWRHRPLTTPTSESRDAVTALEMPHTLTFSTFLPCSLSCQRVCKSLTAIHMRLYIHCIS